MLFLSFISVVDYFIYLTYDIFLLLVYYFLKCWQLARAGALQMHTLSNGSMPTLTLIASVIVPVEPFIRASSIAQNAL